MAADEEPFRLRRLVRLKAGFDLTLPPEEALNVARAVLETLALEARPARRDDGRRALAAARGG